jgi:hypothetical protein
LRQAALLLVLLASMLLGVTRCGVLTPMEEVRYDGHSVQQVTSAIQAGEVETATVDVQQATGKLTGVRLALRDGERWSLEQTSEIPRVIADINRYNATAPDSDKIVVKQEAWYNAGSNTTLSPSPTSNPAPSG